jgi:hypothetical protein
MANIRRSRPSGCGGFLVPLLKRSKNFVTTNNPRFGKHHLVVERKINSRRILGRAELVFKTP